MNSKQKGWLLVGPLRGNGFFVPEQGYISCGLYEEPAAWNRVWNGDEKK